MAVERAKQGRAAPTPARWDRAGWWVSSGYLWAFAGVGAFAPFATLYYRSLGFSGLQVGVLAALPALGVALCGPLWGAVADARSMHRLVLRVALTLGAFVVVARVMDLGQEPRDGTAPATEDLDPAAIPATIRTSARGLVSTKERMMSTPRAAEGDQDQPRRHESVDHEHPTDAGLMDPAGEEVPGTGIRGDETLVKNAPGVDQPGAAMGPTGGTGAPPHPGPARDDPA